MEQLTTLEFIGRGLLIGVGVGAMNAIIMWGFAWAKKRSDRCEQIRFLRMFLIDAFTQMGNARTYGLEGTDKQVHADVVRFVLCRDLLGRDLDNILTFRCAALRSPELFELRKRQSQSVSLITDLNPNRDKNAIFPLVLDLVEKDYQTYSELEWLKLPGVFPGRTT